MSCAFHGVTESLCWRFNSCGDVCGRWTRSILNTRYSNMLALNGFKVFLMLFFSNKMLFRSCFVSPFLCSSTVFFMNAITVLYPFFLFHLFILRIWFRQECSLMTVTAKKGNCRHRVQWSYYGIAMLLAKKVINVIKINSIVHPKWKLKTSAETYNNK